MRLGFPIIPAKKPPLESRDLPMVPTFARPLMQKKLPQSAPARRCYSHHLRFSRWRASGKRLDFLIWSSCIRLHTVGNAFALRPVFRREGNSPLASYPAHLWDIAYTAGFGFLIARNRVAGYTGRQTKGGNLWGFPRPAE
jgi:hypothetical protein